MVEANPWYKNLPTDRGELPDSYGCVGVKADGGGCMAGRGHVGPMRLHRACNNRDLAALQAALEQGDDPNEVEAVRLPGRCQTGARFEVTCPSPPPASPQAGNTPLHSCAYEGWLDGVKALLSAGARVNATNNVRGKRGGEEVHTNSHFTTRCLGAVTLRALRARRALTSTPAEWRVRVPCTRRRLATRRGTSRRRWARRT
jgi:hypothetical protein